MPTSVAMKANSNNGATMRIDRLDIYSDVSFIID
ncbi:unnamed protein product, partial [marine sediment metagenome]